MSRIENLFLDYDDFHISIPEWELSDTGVTALIGPSGSGKTTVFRALIGLEPCPGLRWVFREENIALLPIPARRLGVVFQNYDLFPHMTVRENILFAARARNVDPVAARFDDLVDTLRLKSCLERKTSVISGGEKQRTALVRALIGQPQFLLLDEPFSALDENLKAESRALVKKVLKSRPIPTLMITHDPRDLTELADHSVYIENGSLV